MSIHRFEQRWHPLIETARDAFGGRVVAGKIKEGFLLEDKSGQLCTFYWGETNQPGNAIEVAVSKKRGIGMMPPDTVVDWMENEIIAGRRGSRRRGEKSWSTIGFETEDDVYPFLKKVYELRKGGLNIGTGDAAVSPAEDLLAKYRARTKHWPDNTVALRLAKQRIGQAMLRRTLMEVWNGRCAVTGLSVPRLLRASHIKPWVYSTDEERLNPDNALLLAPQLDAAFDSGLITFNGAGRLEVSPLLTAENQHLLGLHDAMNLRVSPSPEQAAFLAWHGEHRFRG